MKLKKTLAALAAAAIAVTMCAGLAACGNDNNGDTNNPGKPGGNTPGGMNTLVIEAEYIELENVAGAGISSNQSGLEMIYGSGEQADKDKGWSNGYYVGYTYTAECTMDFVFESDKDTTATISIRLGSELGNINLTPREFEVKLNGTVVNYGSWSVLDSQKDMSKVVFKDYTISSNANLVKGENKITVSVKQNDLRKPGVGAPLIDCVKVTSDAKVTYNPIDNPANKGVI